MNAAGHLRHPDSRKPAAVSRRGLLRNFRDVELMALICPTCQIRKMDTASGPGAFELVIVRQGIDRNLPFGIDLADHVERELAPPVQDLGGAG